MRDLSIIFQYLTENQFQPRQFVLDYVKILKLTTSEMHALYCMWCNTPKSLIRGNKDHLQYALVDTIKATSQHLCISGGDGWNNLTPEEKYIEFSKDTI